MKMTSLDFKKLDNHSSARTREDAGLLNAETRSVKLCIAQSELKKALGQYADWLILQECENPPFLKCQEKGKPCYEWYMIFYPLRTLVLAGKLLNNEQYVRTALKYIDIYLTEQLPNGAFSSNFRQTPTERLTRKEFENILRFGKCNVADVGSNTTGIIQVAAILSGEKRDRYIAAVRRWLDNWLPIWALPEGGYGNGIWFGQKVNTPYTCAISTASASLAAFGMICDEYEYVEKAETALEFQFSKWLPNGLPVFMDCYPMPREFALVDYSHAFYLLEGMCWTHYASRNASFKKLLEQRMREWIFSTDANGLLNQWSDSWFNFMVSAKQPAPGEMPVSRLMGLRLGWEMAKSNGIIHAFLYYLNHIENNPVLLQKVELGLKYLTAPLKCRMSGVMSDPEESYGAFAVQATGFAGLSLAEAIRCDVVFEI